MTGQRVCSVDGCESPSRVRGWCSSHYGRWRRTGDVTPRVTGGEVKVRTVRYCRFPDCGRPTLKWKRYCNGHRSQIRRGKELAPLKPHRRCGICSVEGCESLGLLATGMCRSHSPHRVNPQQVSRLLLEDWVANRDRSSGCWEDWPYCWSKGRPYLSKQPVARVIRLWIDGALPEYACHHCDNPACINPDHIYSGTRESNTRDAMARGRLRGNTRPGPRPRKRSQEAA